MNAIQWTFSRTPRRRPAIRNVREVKTQRLLDMGLASWTFGENDVHTPDEWRAATESERTALLQPSGR